MRGLEHVSIFASFDKAGLADAAPDNGRVKLRVFGLFKAGQYFYADDTVTIIAGPDRTCNPDWLEVFSHQWLQSGPALDIDLDDSGDINFKDFAFMVSNLLQGNTP